MLFCLDAWPLRKPLGRPHQGALALFDVLASCPRPRCRHLQPSRPGNGLNFSQISLVKMQIL